MGIIDSVTTDGPIQSDAAMPEYQAEYLRFQKDYPALKGSPALMQRARNLYNMAIQAGPIARSHALSNFRATYGDSPELLMLAYKG